MDNFRELIDLWPRPSVLAADIGVEPLAVKSWYRRNMVPGIYWWRIFLASRRRQFSISLETMAKIADRASKDGTKI